MILNKGHLKEQVVFLSGPGYYTGVRSLRLVPTAVELNDNVSRRERPTTGEEGDRRVLY